ncbi:MAG: biotin carboxylase N-terminal domain-containing protein [Rhodoferax sp.]|nr:biotin carboxylase N-terminal domain-containing protein [Rhodoferax sp.]
MKHASAYSECEEDVIKKLLIANRGEIVCRIERTCRRMGIVTATVHSVADRNSVHVRTVGESIEIGPAPSTQSYLNIDAVLAAAHAVGADAIHPGIGFLSEDPAFAEAVSRAGLLFIGPSADILRRFGDKWAAKKEARVAGVPVIGGSEGSSDDPAEIERLIRTELKLPVVLKAAAGGGGRGVRIIRELDGLAENIQSAMREARTSFGRADLIVEEFIASARHIEVQVAGDGRGNAIHLFERECSLQRRFQKVVEEAPAVGIDEMLKQRIIRDAVRLAESVHYANLGTVEFLVADGVHHFLECNPRLQVEHTVTEEITGLDLVELQLRIAMDGQLPVKQEDVVARGHAVQLRVYAEDPGAGFAPSTGTLTCVKFPEGPRVETAVESGSVISPYYDAMIAKLISRGADRDEAIERSLMALRQTVIAGVETNISFLLRLLETGPVRAGTADNRYIDREIDSLITPTSPTHEEVGLAAALLWADGSGDNGLGLWSSRGPLAWWAYDDGAAPEGPPVLSLKTSGNLVLPVRFGHGQRNLLDLSVDGTPVKVQILQAEGGGRYVAAVGQRVIVAQIDRRADVITMHVPSGRHLLQLVPFLKLEAGSQSIEGKLLAPMMGTILKVSVQVGDRVRKSDVLVIEESMKMEMALVASMDGVVTTVGCRVGDVVERNQTLIEIQPVTGEVP